MRPEDRLQVRCVKYLTAALPAGAWFSGIEHAGRKSLYAGQLQKAKGIKRGLSDLNIWWNGNFYGIELKVDSPVSDSQKLFGEAMRRNGFCWVVLRSVQALDTYLRGVGFPIQPSMAIAAMDHDAKLATPGKASTAKSKSISARPSARRVKAIGAIRSKVLF